MLSELLPRFVELELYHAVLEAVASEQSARMVAMRNATDNANEMVVDLTLEMNKARQENDHDGAPGHRGRRRRSER